MKNFFFAFLFLNGISLFSQTEKGATPIPTQNSTLKTQNSTRAVVVGISDYQEKDIPDLRFADKDALAFANFLRSPGGGSLSTENLRILTNQQATAGQVIAALTWLLEESKPGDQAIIYFSGHGDVETKLLNQLGFLLLWDSPAHVYLAGALPVDMLRQVVSTLSIEMKTRVFVVVDACRAGKLAGNTVIGTQLTGSQLAQQFSQEQKILSCQPNEFSIEGEQWGGGRGVFSYHLCNGLYGLADGDHDGQVSLFEIGRYLEDRVPKEVAPLSQLPLTVGDKSGALFLVDGPTLAALEKQGVPPASIAQVEQRGMLQEVLAKADTSARFWYAGFERTLRAGHFFQPAEDCAEFYFQKLIATESVAALHPALRRNYAAALQDDAQQVMNKFLKTDMGELALSKKTKNEKYRLYPRYLDRAAQLLGTGHYMYPVLEARKHFFQGYLLVMSNYNPDRESGEKALEQFHLALRGQPDMPHAYWQMMTVYQKIILQLDSARYYLRRTAELSPTWTYPYTSLANELYLKSKDYWPEARTYLEQALRIDSTSSRVWNIWGEFHGVIGSYALQEQYFKKAIELDSTYYAPRVHLGAYYAYRASPPDYKKAEEQMKIAIQLDTTHAYAYNQLGNLYLKTQQYAEAEQQFKKSIQLDSTLAYVIANLGSLYVRTRRFAEAEPVLKKAISLDSTNVYSWNLLGQLYNQTRRYAEAEFVLKKAIALDSTNAHAYNYLGIFYTTTQRYAEAEQQYKKSIQLDSTLAIIIANLGSLYITTQRYAEAEFALKKAISLDSTEAYSWNLLGQVYNQIRRYSEEEFALKKAIVLDSTNAGAYRSLGTVYFKSNRPEEARRHFLKTIELSPNARLARLGLAAISYTESKTAEALGYVEQAIGKGITFEELESDEDLAPLRALPEWQALMKKHFPDKVKD